MNKTGKVSGAALFRNLKRMGDIAVATVADRDAIMTYRRRWGMVVAVYDDGDDTGLWELRKNESSDALNDDGNWIRTGGLYKYYQDATPDPDEANIKDVWLRPSDMKLFEIVHDTDNYWAEISSPKIS